MALRYAVDTNVLEAFSPQPFTTHTDRNSDAPVSRAGHGVLFCAAEFG